MKKANKPNRIRWERHKDGPNSKGAVATLLRIDDGHETVLRYSAPDRSAVGAVNDSEDDRSASEEARAAVGSNDCSAPNPATKAWIAAISRNGNTTCDSRKVYPNRSRGVVTDGRSSYSILSPLCQH